MKQLLIISLVIIDMLLASCRKINHETDVSGTVYDATTMAVISQAHVYLLKENGNCFTCNPVPYQDTYSDANGNFSFHYKADKGYSYSLGATAINYFEEPGGSIYVANFKNNKNEKILLKPHAYLKLHIKNTTPFDASDKFVLKEYWDLYGHSINPLYGTAIDTNIWLLKNGNIYNDIYIYIEKNAVGSNSVKQIYCTAFDTTTYDISY